MADTPVRDLHLLTALEPKHIPARAGTLLEEPSVVVNPPIRRPARKCHSLVSPLEKGMFQFVPVSENLQRVRMDGGTMMEVW